MHIKDGDKHLFKHTESFIDTREGLLRDFLNAKTQYNRYKVFMKVIDWVEAKEEVGYYREQEIARLKNQISGYASNDYKDVT